MIVMFGKLNLKLMGSGAMHRIQRKRTTDDNADGCVASLAESRRQFLTGRARNFIHEFEEHAHVR